MPQFIRLVSRVINLSQVREITFEHCTTTIHWHNGDRLDLADIDAAILLETLNRWGLQTASVGQHIMATKSARFWEEEIALRSNS